MKYNSKNTTDFITLKQAEKYCSYSADYLKLRARKGKLQAIKMGRTWVTKKEWIEKYILDTKAYWEAKKQGTNKEKETIKKPQKKKIFNFKISSFELLPFLKLASGCVAIILLGFVLTLGKPFGLAQAKDFFQPKFYNLAKSLEQTTTLLNQQGDF